MNYNGHVNPHCRPHVVILGAGATVATIPNGDKNGVKVTTMDGFIDKMGLRGILAGIKFESDNLEDIYSTLSEHIEYKTQKEQLEQAIINTFSKYQIPDEPTIYDVLILSLREKDAIATFNWDPLLTEAYYRCQFVTNKLPKLFFLHGNVGIKYCLQDHKIYYKDRMVCPKCMNILNPCKLLFPIQHKEYNNDPFIQNQWTVFCNYLHRAFLVTIFGYSAPKTDVEAIYLLKKAWRETKNRVFEQIEIIDIKDYDTLVENWKDFIFFDHVTPIKTFWESSLAQSPRRTVEDFYADKLEVNFVDYPNRLKEDNTSSWEKIQCLFSRILQNEKG